MSENEEIYTAGKNFTLLPALTEWTNLTSDGDHSTRGERGGITPYTKGAKKGLQLQNYSHCSGQLSS